MPLTSWDHMHTTRFKCLNISGFKACQNADAIAACHSKHTFTCTPPASLLSDLTALVPKQQDSLSSTSHAHWKSEAWVFVCPTEHSLCRWPGGQCCSVTPGNVHRELPETETGMQGEGKANGGAGMVGDRIWWEKCGENGENRGRGGHERKAGFRLMREDRTEGRERS